MTKLGFYTLFTASLLAAASSRSCRHSGSSHNSHRTTRHAHKSHPATTTSTLPVPSTTSTTSAASSVSTASGGYIQSPSGNASFTVYTGCSTPACGYTAKGYTAAMNQLSFGAPGGDGGGDACGRCFAITGNADPYSPSYTTNWQTVVVKITDLCPAAANENWCGQMTKKPLNQVNMGAHFDLCKDSGAADAFFPSGRGALTGSYQEVSCSKWSGVDGNPLWNGACLAGEKAAFWPSSACGNKGTAP